MAESIYCEENFIDLESSSESDSPSSDDGGSTESSSVDHDHDVDQDWGMCSVCAFYAVPSLGESRSFLHYCACR